MSSLLDAQRRRETNGDFLQFVSELGRLKKVQQHDQFGFPMLLMFLDHDLAMTSRTSPVNCTRTVARTVFANAVEVIVEDPHFRIRTSHRFRKFPLATLPAGKQSPNRRMNHKLAHAGNCMAPLSNPQRKSAADTDRPKQIKAAFANAEFVLAGPFFFGTDAYKCDRRLFANGQAFNYVADFDKT